MKQEQKCEDTCGFLEFYSVFFLFCCLVFKNFESVFGIRIYAVWGVKGVKHLSLLNLPLAEK